MQINLPNSVTPEERYALPTHDKRWHWCSTRAIREEKLLQQKRFGVSRKTFLRLSDGLSQIFGVFLRLVRFYERGYRNAERKVVKNIELHFPDLPESFKSYKILHLTDLHLDSMAGTGEQISQKIKALECDLCVLTGDYRREIRGRFEQIVDPMKKIATAINAKDGIYAVLGNHDTYMMADLFEDLGITLLANETVTILRGKEKISVTGIDDPHYYYTEHSFNALTESEDGFKIVMVHTPELYDLAAENGYHFYLCGHTHGGQICLPGGFPVVTHLNRGRRFYRGVWQYANMKGYTNQGCGVVGIPIRFNTQSEIALITLHNGKPAN